MGLCCIDSPVNEIQAETRYAGSMVEFPKFAVTGAVSIIPVTAEGGILLIETLSAGLEQWQLPTGIIASTEDPLEAAQTVLKKTTGLSSRFWHEIGKFSCGFSPMTESIYAFEAAQLSPSVSLRPASEAMHSFSFNEVVGLLEEGRITDGQSIAALLQFFIDRDMIVTEKVRPDPSLV